MTRSEPTWARIRSTCSSITAAGVHARRRTGDLVEEVLQDLLPVRRVDDLGVELDGVEPRLASSNAAIGVEGDDAVTRAPGGGAVTESRWLIQTTCSGGRSWKSGDSPSAAVGLAVLRDVVRLDVAAEVARHQLHAVTDAERRDAELEHVGVHLRRPLGVDRGRAAGEDQRERIARAHLGRRDAVADELRVDAGLAHAARDQLAVLAAEVEHEHRPLLGRRVGTGKGMTRRPQPRR